MSSLFSFLLKLLGIGHKSAPTVPSIPSSAFRVLSVNVSGPSNFTALLELDTPYQNAQSIAGQRASSTNATTLITFSVPTAITGGASIKIISQESGFKSQVARVSVNGKTVDELGGLPIVDTQLDPVVLVPEVVAPVSPPPTPAPSTNRDAIKIDAVQFYSPIDPKQYAQTITLQGVEFRSGETFGVRFGFDRGQLNARWPDVVVWPPAGYIQWTLFAGFQINGVWHMGGYHEFWSDRNGPPRIWTGANPLELINGRTNWQANWSYDNRWGALSNYTPRAGDQIALMMVAGSVRPGSSNHPTVAERSNIVVVPLQINATY